jgi:DNA-binding response OmpR family regulator
MNNNEKLVLIAEDDESLGKAVLTKLTEEGYRVDMVKDGMDCLQYLEKENEKPDLLILDILMPVLGGMGVLKKIREDDRFKDIDILVLTNFNDVESVSDVMAFGVTDYLVKSDNSIEKIVEKVKEKLGSENSETEE